VSIVLTEQPFSPWSMIEKYKAEHVRQFGATGIFIGTMRDFNAGDSVHRMRLEHYPGMTEKQLKKIADEAVGRWQIIDSLIVHRVGEIQPDEPIVVVAVWASHRGDAMDACRYLIESLKSSAPFWKKEWLVDGEERWVEHNTEGYATK
jgi:molybdopterin synthase catalytic subunit